MDYSITPYVGDSNVTYMAYTKYNFFNTYISSSMHIYLDRIYLSLLLSDFEKSGIWKSYNMDGSLPLLNMKIMKEKVSPKYGKLSFKFRWDYKTERSTFLLDCIKFLIYGWFSVFIMAYYAPLYYRKRYLKLNFKNIVVKKFIYKSLPDSIFYILRNLIINEKYWIYTCWKKRRSEKKD